MGITKRKIAHTKKCLPSLEIQYGFSTFARFSREWGKYQDIPHRTLNLPPYVQGRSQ